MWYKSFIEVTLNYIFEKNQIMIVQQFNENAVQYKDFQIWDVENMDAFFNGNGVIQEIFEKDYKTLVSNFDAKIKKLPRPGIEPGTFRSSV